MKIPWIIAAVATTAAIAATSLAVAAGGLFPDGSPRAGAPGHAPTRALASYTCGAVVSSTIRTQNERSNPLLSSETFVPVPGAAVDVVVPSGESRCIKVRFTAEAACYGGDSNYCYVRALRSGVPLPPNGSDTQALVSRAPFAGGYTHDWVTRAGAGTHRIVLQGRTSESTTQFDLDDWSFEVEVTR